MGETPSQNRENLLAFTPQCHTTGENKSSCMQTCKGHRLTSRNGSRTRRIAPNGGQMQIDVSMTFGKSWKRQRGSQVAPKRSMQKLTRTSVIYRQILTLLKSRQSPNGQGTSVALFTTPRQKY